MGYPVRIELLNQNSSSDTSLLAITPRQGAQTGARSGLLILTPPKQTTFII